MTQLYCAEIMLKQLSENVSRISLSQQDQLIQCALKCLESRIIYRSYQINSAQDACNYLRLNLAQEVNEIFGVLFLDNKHRILAFEKLFQGTVNTTTVYARVIVQRALAHNAAAVILVHNHPSGSVDPSKEDEAMTHRLKDMLSIIDVNVLDHIIVSMEDTFSFVQNHCI